MATEPRDDDWETLADEPLLEDEPRDRRARRRAQPPLFEDTPEHMVRREASEHWHMEREMEREPPPTWDEL